MIFTRPLPPFCIWSKLWLTRKAWPFGGPVSSVIQLCFPCAHVDSRWMPGIPVLPEFCAHGASWMQRASGATYTSSAPGHVPSCHQTSLTNQKSIDKTVRRFKTTVVEHYAKRGFLWAWTLVWQHTSRVHAAVSGPNSNPLDLGLPLLPRDRAGTPEMDGIRK